MDDSSFRQRIERVEELIAAVQEHGNPVVRASAVEMVRLLLDLHRKGLAKIIERIDAHGPASRALMADLVADDVVSRLLLLHGLHPVDLTARLRQALDHVRPLLVRHGATCEILDATAAAVRLRVCGSDAGVRRLLEEAILEAAPDVLHLDFVDGERPSSLMSLPLVGDLHP